MKQFESSVKRKVIKGMIASIDLDDDDVNQLLCAQVMANSIGCTIKLK